MRKVFDAKPRKRKRVGRDTLQALTVSESRQYFADVLSEDVGKAKALAYQMNWPSTDWSNVLTHVKHALALGDVAFARKTVREGLKAVYQQTRDIDTYSTQLQRIEDALQDA